MRLETLTRTLAEAGRVLVEVAGNTVVLKDATVTVSDGILGGPPHVEVAGKLPLEGTKFVVRMTVPSEMPVDRNLIGCSPPSILVEDSTRVVTRTCSTYDDVRAFKRTLRTNTQAREA